MNEDKRFEEVLEDLVPEETGRERSMLWALAIISGGIGMAVIVLLGYALGGVSW